MWVPLWPTEYPYSVYMCCGMWRYAAFCGQKKALDTPWLVTKCRELSPKLSDIAIT
jgi:hypothetical protein